MTTKYFDNLACMTRVGYAEGKIGDDGLEKISIQKIINEGRCLYI